MHNAMHICNGIIQFNENDKLSNENLGFLPS